MTVRGRQVFRLLKCRPVAACFFQKSRHVVGHRRDAQNINHRVKQRAVAELAHDLQRVFFSPDNRPAFSLFRFLIFHERVIGMLTRSTLLRDHK